MISEIRYYRVVLNKLIDDDVLNRLRFKWSSGDSERFNQQRLSHEYTKKVEFNLLEARMQLGNLLKYITDKPSPYRKASLKRLNGDSDYIPSPIDREGNFDMPEFDTKVETLDYIRELLQEMNDRLNDISTKFDNLNNRRVDIHVNQAISSLALGKNYCGKILGCIKKIREIDNE